MVHGRQNDSLPTRIRTDWSTVLLAVYLLGLSLFSHPWLDLWIGGDELLRPDRILVVPLVVYALYRNVELRITRPVLIAVAFFAAMVLSAVVNGIITPTFLTLAVQYVYVLGLFVLVTSLRPSTDELRELLRFWILVLVVFAVVSIVQSVALNTQSLYPGTAPFRSSTYYGYRRPLSLTAEPSYLATLLSTGFAILFPLAVVNRPVLFSRRTQRLLLGLLTVGILVAASMSGYLIIVGFLGLMLPGVLKRGISVRTIGVAGLLVVLASVATVAITPSFVWMIAQRVSKLLVLFTEVEGIPGSADLRLYQLLTAVEVWRTNPVFGVGIGAYDTYVLTHRPTSFLDVRRLLSVQGAWLHVLAMTGIVGFGLYVAIWGSILRRGIAILKSSSSKRGYSTDLCLIALSVVVVQLVGWTFTHSFIHPYRWAMISVGYLLVLHAGRRTAERSDATSERSDADG